MIFGEIVFNIKVLCQDHAIGLFQRYAKGGDNAGLKAWASITLPTLEHHKEMADKLPKS